MGIFVTHIHVPLCGSSGSFQIGFLSIYKVCSVFSGISLSTSFQSDTWLSFICNEIEKNGIRIGHVNNLPTMPLFTGISRNSQSKSYMLSLTECVRDFQSNELWDMFSVCPRIWQACRTIFLWEYSSYILKIPNDADTTLKFEIRSNFIGYSTLSQSGNIGNKWEGNFEHYNHYLL